MNYFITIIHYNTTFHIPKNSNAKRFIKVYQLGVPGDLVDTDLERGRRGRSLLITPVLASYIFITCEMAYDKVYKSNS